MTTAAPLTAHQTKVLNKLGKRPKLARRVAEQLGYPDGRAVSRTLGELVKAGVAERSLEGFTRTEA